MSQYIHFYIRNDKKFLPIGTYCRSSYVYRICNEAINPPYEKISALNSGLIGTISSAIRSDIENIENRIKRLEKNKALIGTFNNSTEEKLNAINEIDQDIEDFQEILDEYKGAQSFFYTLAIIYDDVKYEDDIDQNAYLYCGIECYKPTVEDIA